MDFYAAWNNDVALDRVPIQTKYGPVHAKTSGENQPDSSGMGRLRYVPVRFEPSLEGTRRRGDSEQRESVISQEVFDTYLNDGIMKAVEETVAAEIGQYVNLDAMVDPGEKDKARDSLPHIKQMLAESNSRITQTKVYYKNRYATFLPFIERYNRKV